LTAEQTNCYVPHYTKCTRDEDEILKCSIVPSIASLPPDLNGVFDEESEAPNPPTIQALTDSPSISPSTLTGTDQPSPLSQRDDVFKYPAEAQTMYSPNL
jgi:hypothetical protein